MAPELAAIQDLVGAHPPQRRRVRVDRHRGVVSAVTHAMDVGRREVKRVTGLDDPGHRRTAECEAVFGHRTLGHGDRAAG